MKNPLILLSSLPCLLIGSEAEFLLDLESFAQDFVLETKKIEVPGYPFAFNPGIVEWRGRRLMSFRILPDSKQKYNSEIGLVFLNDQLEAASRPQLLSLRDENSTAPCRAEDARLITNGDQLLIIYSDNPEKKLSKGGFRVYVAELFYDGEHFYVDWVERLSQFEGESQHLREKNWVPFLYQDNLLLAYSLAPHLILAPRLDGSQSCDTASLSFFPHSWEYGTLRGGTPAIPLEGNNLAIFHSSIDIETIHSAGEKMAHYFMGAYTFSREPPFAITAISKEPIVGKNFYHGTVYTPYWKPIRCVFPCGLIANEDFIWVAYGRDDHECWIAKLDKKGLLNSLIPAF
jgi:predicted GH43/DUF377 family glycosyl hydrolase